MTENELEIIPYGVGLMSASVCTNGSRERAIEYMDDHHPTGLTHGWQPAEHGFALRDEVGNVVGEHASNTLPCDRKPETHTHYLLAC